MNKLRLTRPVTITGRDCFGRQAWLTFTPIEKLGWHWQPGSDGALTIPISSEIAGHNPFPGYLYLEYKKYIIRIVEHVLSLRYTGLDGVCISGSSWPPYHGRPWQVWDKLYLSLRKTSEDVSWVIPKEKTVWEYSGKREGSVSIGPPEPSSSKFNFLSVTVKIDYPGVGRKRVYFRFPNPLVTADENIKELEKCFQARAPGWPRWRYSICRIASRFGWPHMDSVCWPQRQIESETLDLFGSHRVGDLLGGLALAHPTKLLAGNVVSDRAGHMADLGLIRKCNFVDC